MTSGPLNSNSIVAGGYAETQSGGGNATATANVAQITNLIATNVNFYGGVATDSTAANSGDQVIASQNSLSLDNTSIAIDTSNQYTFNSIAGGVAVMTATDFSKASVTASNNTVSVTNSGYTEADSDRNVDANIYGAFISTSNSGAAITASHNAVTVGDNIKVTGDVIGAQASHNGTFVGNTVSFDATLKADSAKSIAGVEVITGTTTTGVTAEKPDVITLTGNTVTLGANAETTNVDIYAAKLGTNNKDDNKTQIIHSGNTTILNGTHIYDDNGTHPIAADDIQIGSTALIHVKNGTLNISGLVTGDSKYLNGTGTVAAGARIVNQGKINVFNSLAVQGDDTLIAASEGALLAVNGGSGATAANANVDSVTKEGATLKISAAGLTNYLTAPEGADSTPSYDLDGDGVNETYDKKGAVQITSGGTLQFTDPSVTISDFDYTHTGVEAGKIYVDSETNDTDPKGSYIKGDHVTVAHKFASNATTATAYKDLNEIDAKGINIEANTLTLGSSTLSSTQSENLYDGCQQYL